MSKELADRLDVIRHRLTLAKDHWGVGLLDEAIAALRAEPEPVGEVTSSGEYALPVFRWLSADHSLRFQIGDKLYAAPSREPTHLYQCCDCGRKSWDESDELAHCNFPQPNGKRCAGQMLPIAPSREDQQFDPQKFVASQQPLGAEFQKVLDENRRELYSRESRTDECVINPVMSCVCKRGTKSCVIAHADPSRTDRQEPSGLRYKATVLWDDKTTVHHGVYPDRQEPGLSADEMLDDEFDAWWKREGRFIRAGGGDYERSFAWGAWKDAMALRSLTARDEGIEAAADAAHDALRGIDRAHAEIAYSAATSALAQGQRTSEQSSKCLVCDGQGWTTQPDPRNGDACQVQCEPCLGTGNEQDADELLREAFDRLCTNGSIWRFKDGKLVGPNTVTLELARRIDAHLARKEPK